MCFIKVNGLSMYSILLIFITLQPYLCLECSLVLTLFFRL